MRKVESNGFVHGHKSSQGGNMVWEGAESNGAWGWAMGTKGQSLPLQVHEVSYPSEIQRQSSGGNHHAWDGGYPWDMSQIKRG